MENTGVAPQSQSALSAEMVAELSAAATGYIEKAIKDSAEAAYAEVAKRIVAETLAVIGDRITTQLRGQTLFGGAEREPFPGVANYKSLPGETIVIKTSDRTVSNYGRVIKSHETLLDPGYLLTEEVIDYLCCGRNDDHDVWNARVQIINKYNEKYALAHNELHVEKIKKIHKEAADSFASHRAAVEAEAAARISDMEAKIAAERKELELEREAQEETERDLDERRDENTAAADLNNAQARLLKIERAEFEAATAADAAKRRTEAEIETSLKQIKIVRRQLAKENAALAKKSAELQAERARLTRLQERIADREAALEFVADVSSDDEQ